ncbi:T-cell antigen CD7 isoform X1 [Marmota marmota marmota]|uniref:CD7 molecule n=1 Tax=Marmota marmota marmota TaxID=9994 RepID=A0A8C5YQA4_MARMA|nr:T-cell antigen CD7 isoform X1 [Marmota marmota marmota]
MALLLLLASALSGTLAAQARGDSRLLVEVQQSPRYKTIPEGGSVSITCSTNGTLKGLYLKQSWPQAMYVVYYEDEESRTSTVDPQFQGRVSFSGPQNNLTITMHHLQKADSGTYTCEAVQDFLDSNVPGPGTMVAVTDTLSLHRCQEPPLTSRALPAALAVGFFLMGLGLGVLCTLRRTQIKGMCTSRKKRPSSVVYEDMCYSRRNTLSTPNQYQ